MAELLHLLVDRGILLDIGIGLRHIGLRLVVVVVGDEVDDGVVREELLHLACHLRRKRLVRLHDERGLVHGLDRLCHRERLARSRDAQKRLIAKAAPHAVCQLLYGLGLVSCRLIGRDDLELRGVCTETESLQLGTEALARLLRAGKRL